MKHMKIGGVMVDDVVKVTYDTPFKEVARLLGEHRISGLPVVDEDEKVIGVISETDLMARQAEEPALDEQGRPHWLSWLHISKGHDADKAHARTAGTLMSAPAITVRAESTIADAARTMAQRRIERLPVVDEEDRLVGIVTRWDLLQVFLRPDEEIRRAVVDEVIVNALWLDPETVTVDVSEGVVTLSGQVERCSDVPIALRMVSQVDGVVAVVDMLTYRLDDSHLRPDDPAVYGVGEEWLRRH
ncbi:CBS domain-containing protein [Streptomyces sp. NBC_01481]|uniref:CBS domain-containing protein n=1 Tax=Streptomyces sp. NBC_01481 TaxID=2975869 RepID=UPI0022555DC1|nr:CBS domain-containing protein [Streptomyces sp. NBC_01481]MCX4585693.1 CBS domain-containing protein [Streptomyces sp. NBC_01481]